MQSSDSPLPDDSLAPAQGEPEPTAHEPLAAEVIDDGKRPQSKTKVQLPHPNLPFAVLLAMLPVGMQFVVGIGVMAVVAIFLVIGGTHDQQQLQASLESFNVYLIPVGTLTTLLIAVAVAWLLNRGHFARNLGWRNCTPLQWLLTSLLVLPMAVIASEVSNCVMELLPLVEAQWLRDFREQSGRVFTDFTKLPWLLVFTGGCLLPGIGEEIYCRGLLSRGLIARYGVVAGTLFASMLFGAMHLDPVQSSSAFVLGIGLQYVFLTTRSLFAPITIHVLNNTAAFGLMRIQDQLPIPGLTAMPDGSIVHTPVLLLVSAVASLLAVGTLLFTIRTRWLLPDGSAWSPGYVSVEPPPDDLDARAVHSRPHVLLIVSCVLVYGALLWALVGAHLAVAG